MFFLLKMLIEYKKPVNPLIEMIYNALYPPQCTYTLSAYVFYNTMFLEMVNTDVFTLSNSKFKILTEEVDTVEAESEFP
jgi:hypothetical protein